MVLDLGRDYYHMSPPELNQLSTKIKAGDMEEVLRLYEKELQSPVKNALLGNLIRTLLIQVQKTKVGDVAFARADGRPTCHSPCFRSTTCCALNNSPLPLSESLLPCWCCTV